MSKVSSWLFVGGAAIAVFALSSVRANGGISGTDHDFSGKGWGTTQICQPCHTPHNAQTVAGAPLWNHAVTAATFTPYTSSTLEATVGQPAGVSKLCLSCHDGTVAMDSFGTHTGTNFMGGTAKLGIDLSNDHPVSFAYNAALVTSDGGLKAPATTGLPLFGTLSDQLECATCHDVHDDSKGDFLRVSNTGSALCLKCHDK